jgi:hypothetical protein
LFERLKDLWHKLSARLAKHRRERAARKKDVPFFPEFAMFELVIMLIAMVGVVLIAVFWPGTAGPAADPAGEFHPESFLRFAVESLPEWVTAIGIGLGFGFVLLLFFIPKLDPGPRRSKTARRVVVLTAVVFLGGWLGIYGAYGLFAIPHGSNNTPGGEWTMCWHCHSHWGGLDDPLYISRHGEVLDENCMTCHLHEPHLVNFYQHDEGLFRSTHTCADCHNPHAPVPDEVTPGDTPLERMKNGGDTHVFSYTPQNGEPHPSLPMNTCFACHEFPLHTGGAAEVAADSPAIDLVGEHPPLGGRSCADCHADYTGSSVGEARCLFSEAGGDVHALYDVRAADCAACHDVSVEEQ